MTFHQINGLRLHVERMGPQDGPPVATVVLVHGLPADSMASYYFTIAPVLAAAGLDVVMYDQRGHGRSARPESGYRLERFVDDLETLLDELDVAGAVHLVGNCFGGVVVFGLTARRPDRVASIFAIESEPPTPQWTSKMNGHLERGKKELVLEETIAEITEKHGAHMARLGRSAGRFLSTTSLADDIPASTETLQPQELERIKCPVLGVYGADSEVVDLAVEISNALPDCRTVLVPDQDHYVLSGAPEQICALILDWLAEQGVAVRPATGVGRSRAS
ncbi:MAG TPA: alpha/beta hydrolase [Sporichthyaceae bacterium]|jgi:pimeloyl-ACP methyl ester carboxylesterase|nr:alpha/beta hydrolase [Sporichthyaceae bacterium]